MVDPLIKIGAALVLAGALFACPAYAVSPLPLNDNASLLIPVEDEENEEVWRDLRPDITPPEAAVGKKEGEAPKAPPAERPMGEGPGDVENEEVWHDLRTGDTPPPAVTGE